MSAETSSRRVWFIAFFLPLAFSLGACAKKHETSRIVIDAPQIVQAIEKSKQKLNSARQQKGLSAASSVASISRIAIQVSGSEMTPVGTLWTREREKTLPATFAFDVTRGTDRLFQVLVVTENGIYYGDVSRTLAKAVEDVTIELKTPLVTTAHELELSGRYFTASGVAPSGTVNMLYNPPNGRPAIRVDSGEIFSGYIHLFVPNIVGSFSYHLVQGTSTQTLFDKVSASTAVSSLPGGSTTKTLVLSVPERYTQSYDEVTGEAVAEKRNAKTQYVGFWGIGAPASSRVCYFGENQEYAHVFKNEGMTDVFWWKPGSTDPVNARRLSGGESSLQDYGCDSPVASQWGVRELAIDVMNLPYGDSAIGARGPFQFNPGVPGGAYLGAALDGEVVHLQWRYLPGVVGASVAGVGIFTKSFSGSERPNRFEDDKALCSSLVSHGYREVARLGAASGLGLVESYDLILSSPEILAYEEGQFQVVMCPYRASGSYHDFALSHESNSGHSPITIGSEFVKIVAGREHTCGITTSSQLKCWGGNSYGQLGDGTSGAGTNKLSPIVIDTSEHYQDVAPGEHHTCAITTSNKLKCWGFNYYGQLGDGTSDSGADKVEPVEVDSAESYQSVSVGKYHTCGVTNSSQLKCWGLNASGQLGNGTIANSPSPVIVGSGYMTVDAGRENTCGITISGQLKCWGKNASGQIGGGTVGGTTLNPTAVDISSQYVSVSVGGDYSCGVTTSNQLKCWGLNASGQLGDGTTVNRTTPVVVVQGVLFQNVSAGENHTCGTTTDGQVKCWGFNGAGQVGDGTMTLRTSPVDVEMSFLAVSTGNGFTCGLALDMSVKCWGNNASGQYGNGTTANSLLPLLIAF
ncbi:MAG: hypothetical protein RBT63_05970 [Bdellovibrionales bacterium]|jgi:alpha-tubulin suppressor-like RCC1 family protein|nr:hypothetical protein [Bdellovibrionales bacterium]